MKRRSLSWIAVLMAVPPLGLIVTPPARAQNDSLGIPAIMQAEDALLMSRLPQADRQILSSGMGGPGEKFHIELHQGTPAPNAASLQLI